MRFEDLYQQYQQYYYGNFYSGSYWGFDSGLSDDEKELFKQIKKDTIEYFGNLNIKITTPQERKSLSKDQKERVVEFMKARLKHYNENGFLLEKKSK